jgi:F-type H+-transporting ATPase subunit b
MVFQLIFFQVLTFAVILVVLRLLFGSQLKTALNRLQDLQQESLEKEEILNKEIERARAQTQNEIERSKEEARVILENARKIADRAAQDGLAQVQTQARKILTDAAERAKQMEASVSVESAARAVSLAEELFVRVFTERDRAAFHEECVGEFCDELAKVGKERLNMAAKKVDIVSVRPFSAATRQRFAELIREKLGSGVEIDEKIDPSLLAGVVLQMGGLVVDGSLKNKLRKAMDALRQR